MELVDRVLVGKELVGKEQALACKELQQACKERVCMALARMAWPRPRIYKKRALECVKGNIFYP